MTQTTIVQLYRLTDAFNIDIFFSSSAFGNHREEITAIQLQSTF